MGLHPKVSDPIPIRFAVSLADPLERERKNKKRPARDQHEKVWKQTQHQL